MTLIPCRPWTPDSTICDWLQLQEHLRGRTEVSTAELRRLWLCSQPTVSRRLAKIRGAGLARIDRQEGTKLWEVLPLVE